MIRKRSDHDSPAGTSNESAVYKPSRSYIKSVSRAVTHPVRTDILKALKEGDKSTVELEQVTGETRYNLYHHLNALEQIGLVGWSMKDNKTKLYHAEKPRAPEVAVIILTNEDIKAKQEKFGKLIASLREIEDEAIPNPENITSAEICLYYSWE
jgi:hypothetical protein